MSQNGIRKAAAEDKEHGVAQKSPINNVTNRLQIIINKCYHGNMYDKLIILGVKVQLPLFSLIRV